MAGQVAVTTADSFVFRTGKVFLIGDGSVRFVGPSLHAIVADIVGRSRFGSVGLVVLGPADVSGWKLVSQPKGIIAILIGLLLPAVQKVRTAASTGGGGTAHGRLTAAMQKVRMTPARQAVPAASVTTPDRFPRPGEQQALRLLRPCLAPGATLWTLGFKPRGLEGVQWGFTGGVEELD